MVEYLSHRLNGTFSALADPTRRTILNRLRKGRATVSEIAAPFDISLAAVSKHLRVLERVGLIEREVRGRTHHCQLNAEPLREMIDWASRYQRFWEERLDALDAFLRIRGRRRQSRRKPR